MSVLIVAVVLLAVPCSLVAVALGAHAISSPPQVVNITIEQMAVSVDQRSVSQSAGDQLEAEFRALTERK